MAPFNFIAYKPFSHLEPSARPSVGLNFLSSPFHFRGFRTQEFALLWPILVAMASTLVAMASTALIALDSNLNVLRKHVQKNLPFGASPVLSVSPFLVDPLPVSLFPNF